mmetsp:Transcript_5263/g.6727  ORF Transcript_5263/g.6727 Transcript_5263/m.6727 type:complete len:80 (+) Transcript_5263:52-291(+)
MERHAGRVLQQEVSGQHVVRGALPEPCNFNSALAVHCKWSHQRMRHAQLCLHSGVRPVCSRLLGSVDSPTARWILNFDF